MSVDESMSRAARVPLLAPEQMTPQQRQVHDQVLAGPRGQMVGPLRAAIHSPELAARWSMLGEFLRFGTCLPKRLNELAILVTGRRWSAQVEWWVHAAAGVEAGLAQSTVEAIRAVRPPLFEQREDLEVYEFARLLQQTGHVPGAYHDAIVCRWGIRGVVELTAVIGYYTMVAMTLNAHQMPVPDGSMPLPATNELLELPPGRLAEDVAA